MNAFHLLSLCYGTPHSLDWGRCFNLSIPQMSEVSWINPANDRNVSADLKRLK